LRWLIQEARGKGKRGPCRGSDAFVLPNSSSLLRR
jgi:hypothetical protein